MARNLVSLSRRAVSAGGVAAALAAPVSTVTAAPPEDVADFIFF